MKPQPPQVARLRPLAWALLLVPIWFLLWAAKDMWLTYSPTPFNDQWANVHAWRDTSKGGWLAYLFSQHNEHRILFPRLVFIADWKWFQARNGLNLAAIGLIQLAGAAVFAAAAQVRRAGALGLLGLAAALALMFSLMQFENLFWTFQVAFVGVYAAGAWALYLFCRASAPGAVRWGWLAGAMVLLVLAAFNMANGLFAGAAMAAVGLVTRRSRAAILTAAAVTLVLLVVYLHGYQPVSYHSPPSLALRHPARYLFYVAVYIGNIWSPGRPLPAALLGLVGAAATAAMAAILARKQQGDPARSALFGLALFVGVSAAVTALGRLSFGVDQALSSRYTTPTAYFWAAQALFWTLTAERGRGGWLQLQRSPAAWTLTLERSRAALARVGLAAVLVLALVRLAGLERLGDLELLGTMERIQLGSSALLGGIDDDDALRAIHPVPAYVREVVPFMRQTRISLFADPPVAAVGAPFARPAAPPGACLGFFDSLAPAPQGAAWRAVGWGWDVAARRPPDRIVLTDAAGRVLGVGLSGLVRDDVSRAQRKVTRRTSGWIAALNRGAGGEVVAYGLTAAGQACELGRKAWPQ